MLPPLEAANGQEIVHEGACTITFSAQDVQGQEELFSFRFQITNVKCAIISQQDLLEADFIPHCGRSASFLESPSGKWYSLVLEDRIWFLKAKRVGIRAEAWPIAIGPVRQPAELSPRLRRGLLEAIREDIEVDGEDRVPPPPPLPPLFGGSLTQYASASFQTMDKVFLLWNGSARPSWPVLSHESQSSPRGSRSAATGDMAGRPRRRRAPHARRHRLDR